MTKPIIDVWAGGATISALTPAQIAQGYAYTAAKPGQLAGTVETTDLDYPMKQATIAIDWLLNNFDWKSQPIGVPIAIRTDLGAPEPPTNDPDFRYIKLTYSDAYNAGVISAQTLTGTAPAVLASGIINLAGSPMNGQSVRFINTMTSIIRPEEVGGSMRGDTSRNITGSFSMGANFREGIASSTGAFESQGAAIGNAVNSGTSSPSQNIVGFDASNVVPTSIQNQQYSESAIFYMRIL